MASLHCRSPRRCRPEDLPSPGLQTIKTSLWTADSLVREYSASASLRRHHHPARLLLRERPLFTSCDRRITAPPRSSRMIASVTRSARLVARIHFHGPETINFSPFAPIRVNSTVPAPTCPPAFATATAAAPIAGASCFGHSGCGRLFDHLLMTPLQRTVALIEMNGVTLSVRKDLQFDMSSNSPRTFQSGRARHRRQLWLPAPGTFRRRSSKSAWRSTRRIPLPPPPATAFISTG